MKTFKITYLAKVKRFAEVEAESPTKAVEEFEAGNFNDGHEIECWDIEFFELEEKRS